MKKRLLAIVLTFFAVQANAAEMVVDVGGTLYDVGFQWVSYGIALNKDEIVFWETTEEAEAASYAINQILTDENIVQVGTSGNRSQFIVAYDAQYDGSFWQTSRAFNQNLSGNPANWQYMGDSTSSGPMQYTAWTTSPVPLPAAAWLFLSAIGGLVVIKRKRS